MEATEEFSTLVALAGRPALIDPAQLTADLFISGQRAGLSNRQLMTGLTMLQALGGSPTPGCHDLNRLIVYQALRRLAAQYRRDPAATSWMPGAAASNPQRHAFYQQGMAHYAPLIDGMYAALRARIDREFPGYLNAQGKPLFDLAPHA